MSIARKYVKASAQTGHHYGNLLVQSTHKNYTISTNEQHLAVALDRLDSTPSTVRLSRANGPQKVVMLLTRTVSVSEPSSISTT